MGIAEIERDLRFIRETMESAARYTNVPAAGYLTTGILGLIGTGGTYLFLGSAKVLNMALITPEDLKILVVIWLLVFLSAVGSVIFFSWRKARQHGITAWNSLAARMFLSQIPLIVVTGILTIAMALKGHYSLIPGMWLGIYGTILYSFSYFTGFEHKIEGFVFIVLGIIVMFIHGLVGFVLLGVGFGGIHIVSGLIRWFSRGQRQDESK